MSASNDQTSFIVQAAYHQTRCNWWGQFDTKYSEIDYMLVTIDELFLVKLFSAISNIFANMTDVHYNSILISTPDDVIQRKHFPRYWPFVKGIHRSLVNSPHKCQWRGACVFSLICVWTNGWVNNREAGDLRRHRAHYDVTVIFCMPNISRWHQSKMVMPDVFANAGAGFLLRPEGLVRQSIYRYLFPSMIILKCSGLALMWKCFINTLPYISNRSTVLTSALSL